jgi:hypothetical protein
MMLKKGSIPRKDAEAAAWGDNFVTQLTANATQWAIPTGEITDLKTALTNYKTYLAQAESPARTKIVVAQKNATRARFEEKAREMINFRLKNPIITDSQLTALGVHVPDRTPSRIPAPTSCPDILLEVLDVRRLLLHTRYAHAARTPLLGCRSPENCFRGRLPAKRTGRKRPLERNRKYGNPVKIYS